VNDRDDWFQPPVDTSPDPEPAASPVADPGGEIGSSEAPSRPSWDQPEWSSPFAPRADERTEVEPGREPDGESGPEDDEKFHHPLDRVTGRLPRRARIVVDWVVTIVGAIAIVLAIKAYVVNPYRIPSSSMEPTLHCARPATGCEARFSDRVLANRFIYHFRDPARGDIVVFETTPAVIRKCSAGGTFVKRIIGLPGETVRLRLVQGREFVYINGRKLDEPYVQPSRRGFGPEKTYKVPQGQYFLMGDNRSSSCDSRQWGGLPRDNILGKVFMTYWPPQRISFR
jgi:signal peptidase I